MGQPLANRLKGSRGIVNRKSPVVGTKATVLGSLKKGGKIAKTGAYQLHKGEKVVPAKKKTAK